MGGRAGRIAFLAAGARGRRAVLLWRPGAGPEAGPRSKAGAVLRFVASAELSCPESAL